MRERFQRVVFFRTQKIYERAFNESHKLLAESSQFFQLPSGFRYEYQQSYDVLQHLIAAILP